MINLMDMGGRLYMMGVIIRGNGKMMNIMGKENMYSLMELFYKGFGKMINCKVDKIYIKLNKYYFIVMNL